MKPRSFLEHFPLPKFSQAFVFVVVFFLRAVFCGVFGKICFNLLWQCEVVQIPVTFLVIDPNSSNIHIPVPEVCQGLHGPLSMLAPSLLNSNER